MYDAADDYDVGKDDGDEEYDSDDTYMRLVMDMTMMMHI